jgi:hypothetical protein
MAGFVPNEYLAILKEALLGKTTITSGSVYLGLARSLPADPTTAALANIQEVVTAGYARKLIPTANPSTVLSPSQIVVPTAFSFNALSADMVDAAFYAFVTDSSSGNGSNISAPTLNAPSTATTGGALAAATYYYKLTALTAAGETTGSAEVSQVTTGTTSVVNHTWTYIPGATGYKLYRGTSAGAENVLVATLGPVVSYTDVGGTTSAATVPGSNTAAGGKIRYVWELPEPVQGRNGEALTIPANALIIE